MPSMVESLSISGARRRARRQWRPQKTPGLPQGRWRLASLLISPVRPVQLNRVFAARPEQRVAGFLSAPAILGAPHLELDEQREIEPVLYFPEIRSKAWHPHGRITSIAPRRRNAASSGEIRDIRRSMIKLPAESNVLAGHVIEGGGGVPSFIWVSGIFCEVGWSAPRFWSTHKVTPGGLSPV